MWLLFDISIVCLIVNANGVDLVKIDQFIWLVGYGVVDAVFYFIWCLTLIILLVFDDPFGIVDASY